MSKIIYTHTDEAPMLATYSFLPIIQTFTKACNVKVETRDISVAGRVLSLFPDYLSEEQKLGDHLAELGDLCKTPEANIIKLPNISASIPQLVACIKELNEQGYPVPAYPEEPQDDKEKEIKARYAKVLGSAVNPVLRQGNSDRRVADAVKAYAQKYPHKLGKYSADCKSHVSHMEDKDFFSSEKSTTMEANDTLNISFTPEGGEKQTLKDNLPVLAGEVIDCSVMSCTALREFFEAQMQDCKDQGILFSLHMKATMMKISDPIMFGHCVSVFYKNVFEKYADLFAELKITPNNGVGDVYAKIKGHEKQAEVEAALLEVYKTRPPLAMVDSDKGITNLHVPSDIIIDASMPVVVRDSGKMWTPENTQQDVKCCIPDRSYAGIYKACLEYCKKNGQFDVSTMGNVSNVGLMAQKAEEYGSHDKTFEMSSAGVIEITNAAGTVLMSQAVAKGDIFRACQTKDAAIKDWVKLAVSRAKATNYPAVFWLDASRAHDAEILKKVHVYLKDHDTTGLEILIKTPVEAIEYSMERATNKQSTISVTGNVLRDYLTDLFPILELGTSAKMLSIVPQLAGGGMYETGAGGSAPKHVEQFTKENHLRWDSLGEFLALAVSLEELGAKTGNSKGVVLAKALHAANTRFLDSREAQVSRKAGELDNRGSHFYLALYWAQALAEQTEDADLQGKFAGVVESWKGATEQIVKELNECQKVAVDLGGYYHPDPVKTSAAMRPCKVWNDLLEKAGKDVQADPIVSSPSKGNRRKSSGVCCIGSAEVPAN
ncbi:unnamed protein product [Amoebophrya sp. A120]|nr:unnamed protein product [Amoebophrya sp. A120]|eukprot:GSA120T00023601001.1